MSGVGATGWREANKQNRLRRAAGMVVERLEGRALMAAGQLDPTFGNAGTVITHLNDLGATFNDVVVQSDGKILAAGTSHSASTWQSDFLLCRYNADGTPDASFGNNGIVVTDLGEWLEDGKAVAVRPDGTIYLAGSATGGSRGRQFALLRYLANGTLDSSFGAGGYVLTRVDPSSDAAGESTCNDMVMQDDGKIVLAGGYVGAHGEFAAARFNLDGTLDTSFGAGGKVVVDLGGDDDAQAVAMAPDGKIVLGGVSIVGQYLTALVRLNPNGSLDTAFGTGGASVAGLGSNNQMLYCLTVQPNGKILTGGWGGGDGMTIARFDVSGYADTTFGAGGVAGVKVKGVGANICYDLAVQSDGRILAAGTGGNAIAVSRLNYDGAPDRSFNGGGSGYIVVPLEKDIDGVAGQAFAVALQSDGQIVVAGHAGRFLDPAVLRIDRGPLTDLPPDVYLSYRDVLSVQGTNGNDYIELKMYQDPEWGPLLDVIVNGKSYAPIDAWFVIQIVIQAGAGDDVVVLGDSIGSSQYFNFGRWSIGAYISGGDGNDRLVGGAQNDSINGNAGKDRIDGGYGDDRLAGNGGNDAIVGYVGVDRIYGDNGNDRIEAGNGNDRIYGGDGNDLIGGGAGADSIYGGDGVDTIAGGSGGGTDHVYDAYSNEMITGTRVVFVNPVVLTDSPLKDDLNALLA